MTKIYFVRHAQPDHSWQDNRTRPLTREGREDSCSVTAFFKDIPVDAFYCSPYVRSLHTIAGAARGKVIHTDERLRERDSLPGSNSREMIEKRWEDPSFHEPGGESLRMVQKRNIQALKEILAEHPGQTLVVGTHGTALCSILNYYDPSFSCRDFFRIIDWMPYILELDFEGDRLVKSREHLHILKEFKGNIR